MLVVGINWTLMEKILNTNYDNYTLTNVKVALLFQIITILIKTVIPVLRYIDDYWDYALMPLPKRG